MPLSESWRNSLLAVRSAGWVIAAGLGIRRRCQHVGRVVPRGRQARASSPPDHRHGTIAFSSRWSRAKWLSTSVASCSSSKNAGACTAFRRTKAAGKCTDKTPAVAGERTSTRPDNAAPAGVERSDRQRQDAILRSAPRRPARPAAISPSWHQEGTRANNQRSGGRGMVVIHRLPIDSIAPLDDMKGFAPAFAGSYVN